MAPLATQEQDSILLTAYDLHLFNEGKHNRLFEKFGAHVVERRWPARHLLCRVGAER